MTTSRRLAFLMLLPIAIAIPGCAVDTGDDAESGTSELGAAGISPDNDGVAPGPPRLRDPCNATIVEGNGRSFTARDLCRMIAGSGKSVTVFHTQCYGGGAVECCGAGGGGRNGCHHSAGHSGERTGYGEYDMGATGALRPGATGGAVHGAGAANTRTTTPESTCPGQAATIGAGDTVITFAGVPLPASGGLPSDHDLGQQVSGQNGNTTNLEGNGTAPGVEGAATAANLAAAIAAGTSKVWIIIYDHGNAGGTTTTATVAAGESVSMSLDMSPAVLADMAVEYNDNAVLFLDSPSAFPDLLQVEVAGRTYEVAGRDAQLVEFGSSAFYRYQLPVPEEDVGPATAVGIQNLTGPEAVLHAFMDSGPISKHGADLRGVDAAQPTE